MIKSLAAQHVMRNHTRSLSSVLCRLRRPPMVTTTCLRSKLKIVCVCAFIVRQNSSAAAAYP